MQLSMNKSQKGCKFIILLLLVEGVFINVFPQEFVWKAGVNNFFDNAEFEHSNVQIPQTMAGVRFVPQVGIKWADNHRVFVGLDAMHEYGSNKTVDYFNPVAYYEFTGNHFRFYAGSVPRKIMLDKYPRMFFQDSISNYRPVVNGIFWEYFSDGSYLNIWMDWVSRQTYTRRESFFMGWSGRYNLHIFYGQHFAYMLHLAGVMEPVIPEGLHDNGLIAYSLGIDLSSKINFEKFEANAGLSLGMERDRDIGEWHYPRGFLSELKIEYKGLELYNTYYNGQRQQIFRHDHGSDLYWGDPFYRNKSYDRADLSVLFYKSDVVNVKFTWSLHLTEQTMFHQQLFYATFDLDNFKKKGQKKYQYIWDSWFR